MEIWLIITLIGAGIVFGLDYLIRRKSWKNNSKIEKTSLLVNMFTVGPYAFLSAVSMFWGLASDSPSTFFGEVLYEITLILGEFYFIVAFVAIILSLILRKKEKIKASIWVNIIAVGYIILLLAANLLIGVIL